MGNQQEDGITLAIGSAHAHATTANMPPLGMCRLPLGLAQSQHNAHAILDLISVALHH